MFIEGMSEMFQRIAWRRLALVMVTCVALAGVGTGVASAAAGSNPPAAHPSSGPKPTIVLVHGAFADSNSWNTDITVLRQLGFPVVAVANPLRSLTGDSDYVRSVLQT